MADTKWWYEADATPVGYLADDGKWFFKTSGEIIGYRDGKWIYTQTGSVIGYFDDDAKWIYNQTGQPLGYLA